MRPCPRVPPYDSRRNRTCDYGIRAMSKRFDDCEYCGGKVRGRKVTVDLRRGDKLYVFRNVPVGVCAKCGERYYPGPVLEQLEALAAHGINGAKRVSVPVLDLAKVG